MKSCTDEEELLLVTDGSQATVLYGTASTAA